jgi:hypothetical protein
MFGVRSRILIALVLFVALAVGPSVTASAAVRSATAHERPGLGQSQLTEPSSGEPDVGQTSPNAPGGGGVNGTLGDVLRLIGSFWSARFTGTGF